MHAAATTLVGLLNGPVISFFMGKDLPEGVSPSYRIFGFGGFFRYVLSIVVIHHIVLFMIESFTLFDPLFLVIRIGMSVVATVVLICTIEAFNVEAQESEE